LSLNNVPEFLLVILIEESSKKIGGKDVIFSGNGGQMRHRTNGRLHTFLWECKISCGKYEGKGPLTEIGVDERIILKGEMNE
jgi:hypothetical protein